MNPQKVLLTQSLRTPLNKTKINLPSPSPRPDQITSNSSRLKRKIRMLRIKKKPKNNQQKRVKNLIPLKPKQSRRSYQRTTITHSRLRPETVCHSRHWQTSSCRSWTTARRAHSHWLDESVKLLISRFFRGQLGSFLDNLRKTWAVIRNLLWDLRAWEEVVEQDLLEMQ